MNLRIDVLFNPGFTSPIFAPCESVTVFHDLQHRRHPEYFRWFDLPFWRLFLYLSAMRSSALIAVSQATLDDILAYYRVRPNKLRLVPLGVDENMFEIGKHREPDTVRPYLLCVSTLHAHKNVERLLHAFYAFRQEHPAYRLLLVGLRGFHAGQIERLVKELNLQSAVEITGWIPREKLYRLFQHASAFIYPSSFEGFGMPVLEAMAAGIPTACSAIEPLTTNSGSAALHFEPTETDEIRRAMVLLTGDETVRARLSREGPLRAAQFRWREAAVRTLAAIAGAAGGGSARD
jgi:glycosyltransferase involved in cell wall biosynthesis